MKALNWPDFVNGEDRPWYDCILVYLHGWLHILYYWTLPRLLLLIDWGQLHIQLRLLCQYVIDFMIYLLLVQVLDITYAYKLGITWVRIINFESLRLPRKDELVWVDAVFSRFAPLLVDACPYVIAKLESEGELGPNVWLGLTCYLTIKLVNNLLWDHQPDSYSLGIILGSILGESEKFEEFVLVMVWNPNSSIDYWHNESLVSVYGLVDSNWDVNWTFLSEFQGVGLQA